jgi:hypothetical protein
MGDWRHSPYPFPAAHAVEVLFDVFDRMPAKFGVVLESTPTDKFVVAVADPEAAVCLRLILDGDRLIANDGLPIFYGHEVIFAIDARNECEALREHCPSEVRWFSIIVIHAQTEAAWRAFDDAYWSVIAPASLQ